MKMENKDNITISGKWRLTARDTRTGDVIVKEGHNLITTVGKALVGDMLIDETGYDTGLTYCAIGSSDTAVAVADTTLGTESARKAVTAKSRSGAEITYSTFFTAAESTYAIEEAGMFGHSTASATPDSGVLFNHYLVSFDNSGGLYDITIDVIITLS